MLDHQIEWSSFCIFAADNKDVLICGSVLMSQVVCALIGSLGALYTGIVVANLMLALFALVAIESGSQSLGRAYVGLLALALVLDILWFILFTSEIRYSSWLFLVLIKVHLKFGFVFFFN